MGEPQPVSSGTFRIDRAQALRKLSEYQLFDPAGFVLCWIRAAVASGASDVRVEIRSSSAEVRFNGPPWPRAELEDPCSAFFESEGKAAARARHFMTGALAALRLHAREVVAQSGADGDRRAVRIDSAGPTPCPPEDCGGETILSARWGDDPIPQWVEAQIDSQVRERCGMLPASLRLFSYGEEKAIPRIEVEDLGVAVAEGGMRARIFLSPPGASESVVHLYILGVRVSTLIWTFPLAQVEVHLNDEGLALDASQASIALDGRLQEALSAIPPHAEPLLRAALERQEDRYCELTRFIFEAGRAWSGFFTRADWRRSRPLDWLFAAAGGLLEARALLLRWETGLADWLRLTASRLPPEPPYDELQTRLYRAPLYLTVTGEPMSVEGLDALWKRCRVVPASRHPFPGENLDPPVLWCARKDDPLLTRRFGDRVSWFTTVEAFKDTRPVSKPRLGNG